MGNEHTSPRIYAIMWQELTNFVRNIAKPGDIATTYDKATKYRYVYYCTSKNIGKDVEPDWLPLDERATLRIYLEGMPLEEKVDFLIEKYIRGQNQMIGYDRGGKYEYYQIKDYDICCACNYFYDNCSEARFECLKKNCSKRDSNE